jgi:RNA polymerase sigma-70 factor (ECF subfamily)
MDTATREQSWALIIAAQKGDQSAFAQLWEQYSPMVFRFVLTRLGNWDQAEDITSETFTRGLQRLGTLSYRFGKDPGAWFVTIARNLILDLFKSSRYRLETTVGDMHDGLVEDPDSPEVLTVDSIALGELKAQLNQAVAQLGEQQRRVVELRFGQALSVKETAEEMGDTDVGATKARQHRAVQRLRHLLRGLELD